MFVVLHHLLLIMRRILINLTGTIIGRHTGASPAVILSPHGDEWCSSDRPFFKSYSFLLCYTKMTKNKLLQWRQT